MLPFYQAQDRIEAQLLGDFLDRHLVDTVILGDYLSGAIGELPADISPTVWILHREDLDRARELLARFLAQSAPDDTATPWTCTACGERVDGDFNLCWNCNSIRATES